VNDHSSGPYTLPAYLAAGQHSVTVVDTAETNGRLMLASVTVQGAAEANLTNSHNQTGMAVDSRTFSRSGGLAGATYNLSSNMLDNGLGWNGQPLYFGPTNANDVVPAQDRTTQLPQIDALQNTLRFLSAVGKLRSTSIVANFSDLADDLPIEMEVIGAEQAKATSVILITDSQ
jgi:hypothetical protein